MKITTRPKYTWLIVLALVAVFAYAGWGLASLYWPPRQAEELAETAETETQTETETDTETEETEDSSEEESSSTRSTGDGVDDFGACNEDAKIYCSGLYTNDWISWAEENGYSSASWKLSLVDCLGQNRDYTSEACDASLDRRAELNENLNEACAVDRAMYCQGVEPIPGSEPMVDCLKAADEEGKLTPACQEALYAHEDAKAE